MAKLLIVALAEDTRGVRPGPYGVRDLARLAEDSSAEVRRAAVRGLGRLQDAGQATLIAARFDDADGAVRAEAVNAYGQSLQSLRTATPEARRALVAAATAMLATLAARTRDESLRGTIGRTLGRLPFADSQQARAAERAIAALWSAPRRQDAARDLAEGIAHGLYAIARGRRVTGALTTPTTDLLHTLAAPTGAGARPTPGDQAVRTRRLAMLALSANGSLSRDLVQEAAADPDEQLRRLAVAGLATFTDTAERVRFVTRAIEDRSWLVRLEAVRAWRSLVPIVGCARLAQKAGDANPHVALAALDGVTGACGDRSSPAVLSVLLRLTARVPVGTARARGSWHAFAHALVALSRVAPDSARQRAREAAASPLWPVRVYVARAANELSDTMLLARLAADSNGNVREAALNGLRERVAHRADDAFLDALSSADYHVVLAAAEALKGTPHRDERTVGALFTALDRLTKEGRENARDPRSALLDRIEELAAAREASRLRPLVADFDSTIAQRAARILSQWTASTVVAAPVLRAAPDDPVAEMLGGQFELVFHMAPASRGGSFVVRLDTRGAPATAARLVRLARAGYYDGLTFHRVEPGFVIQGGSPQATEYVGDGPFMRDELGLASHRRGTLGISTRGRDTGDAQVFVNLVDNVRLDHDYTVVGEIVRDREIAESVLEAQVIARVEVRRVR